MSVYRHRLIFKRGEKAKNLTHREQLDFLRSAISDKLPCEGGKKGRFSFGPAVSTGHESECEYVDCWLSGRMTEKEIKEALAEYAAQGYELLSARGVPLLFPSVENAAQVAEYEIFFEDGVMPDEKTAEDRLASGNLIYEKTKGDGSVKRIEVSRFVYGFKVKPEDGSTMLRLRYFSGASVKPEIVMKTVFGLEKEAARVVRKKICWIDSGGELKPV